MKGREKGKGGWESGQEGRREQEKREEGGWVGGGSRGDAARVWRWKIANTIGLLSSRWRARSLCV